MCEESVFDLETCPWGGKALKILDYYVEYVKWQFMNICLMFEENGSMEVGKKWLDLTQTDRQQTK